VEVNCTCEAFRVNFKTEAFIKRQAEETEAVRKLQAEETETLRQRQAEELKQFQEIQKRSLQSFRSRQTKESNHFKKMKEKAYSRLEASYQLSISKQNEVVKTATKRREDFVELKKAEMSKTLDSSLDAERRPSSPVAGSSHQN